MFQYGLYTLFYRKDVVPGFLLDRDKNTSCAIIPCQVFLIFIIKSDRSNILQVNKPAVKRTDHGVTYLFQVIERPACPDAKIPLPDFYVSSRYIGVVAEDGITDLL